jgi:hypothetical protein
MLFHKGYQVLFNVGFNHARRNQLPNSDNAQLILYRASYDLNGIRLFIGFAVVPLRVVVMKPMWRLLREADSCT